MTGIKRTQGFRRITGFAFDFKGRRGKFPEEIEGRERR